MEFSTACYHVPLVVRLVLFFSILWPFVAMSAFAARGRSSAPIGAMLVPPLLFTACGWIGLANVVRGMAIAGGGVASAAAGTSESLAHMLYGWVFALAVVVFAAIRRHRVHLDRVTLVLVGMFVAVVVSALLSAPALDAVHWHAHAAMAVAIVCAGAATLSAAWAFLVGRGRVTSRALPYGVTAAVFAGIIGLNVVVWRTVHHYHDVAIHGWR